MALLDGAIRAGLDATSAFAASNRCEGSIVYVALLRNDDFAKQNEGPVVGCYE